MAKLAVNVDHIATLRQARGVTYPEPAAAAIAAETAGADGIVVHLREDRRHIQERDVRILRQIIQSKLILEMAATSEMLGLALEIKPDTVTLVPEKKRRAHHRGRAGFLSLTIPSSVKASPHLKMPVWLCAFLSTPTWSRSKWPIKSMPTWWNCTPVPFAMQEQTRKKLLNFQGLWMPPPMGHKLKLGVNAGHGLCYNTIKAFQGFSNHR